MSQINSLTVNDGAATPVPVTFQVYDRDGTRSHFRTSDAALVKGQKELIHSATIGTKANSANIAKYTTIYPVEVTENGITRVDSVSTATTQFNFAPGLTDAQRAAFMGLHLNIGENADVKTQNKAVAPLS